MHPSKWVIYTCIAGFGLFLLYTVISVATISIEQARELNVRQLQQAKQQKKIADSLSLVASQQFNNTVKQKTVDSLSYLSEKQKLQFNYLQQQKKYEADLADVAILSNNQLDSNFSVRKMLSDSAVNRWR